jgi:hypothetical protein
VELFTSSTSNGGNRSEEEVRLNFLVGTKSNKNSVIIQLEGNSQLKQYCKSNKVLYFNELFNNTHNEHARLEYYCIVL